MEHNNEQQNTDIKENILNKIRMEELTMRPKAYFRAKVALLVVVTCVILVVSILIFNFIFFSLRINGHESLLQFGFRGILLFVELFSWTLLAVGIALLLISEWVMRRFRFGYKVPVLYLLFGILIATISLSLLIDRGTSFNDDFLTRAEQHRMPSPFGIYFEGARNRFPRETGICRCTIVAIEGNRLYADDVGIGTTTRLIIIVPPDDPFATTSLSIGDIVFIAGDRRGDLIEAFGISKFPRRLEGMRR